MKTVVLALLVLVVVSQGEALRCRCSGVNKHCLPVQTCYISDPVCGKIAPRYGPSGNFDKGCMNAATCRAKSNSPSSYGSCCTTDLCNA